jgi:hypothetical protein
MPSEQQHLRPIAMVSRFKTDFPDTPNLRRFSRVISPSTASLVRQKETFPTRGGPAMFGEFFDIVQAADFQRSFSV